MLVNAISNGSKIVLLWTTAENMKNARDVLNNPNWKFLNVGDFISMTTEGSENSNVKIADPNCRMPIISNISPNIFI
jgi:hypothetical protein